VAVEHDFPGRITVTDIEKIHWSGRPAAVKFVQLLVAYWRYMGRVSTLVVGGGTLIHDTPSLGSTFLLTCLCLIARARGCRVVAVGLGAQDIKSMGGRFLCRVLGRMFHRLCLRDERSFRQFQAFLPGDARVVLTADLAYTMPVEAVISSATEKIIAITLVDYIFTRAPAGDNPYEILAHTLSGMMADGYRIRFLALQKPRPDMGVAGDRAVLERVMAFVPAAIRDAVEILDLEATPESMAACFDGVALVAGMRFHSLIFAAMHGIPFVGLGDEPKVEEVCHEYGMACVGTKAWQTKLAASLRDGIGAGIDTELAEKYRHLSQKNFEDFS
jgi:polysaccharide pyruvyl transferase WcaK-like protein